MDKHTILIADDEALFRAGLSLIIEDTFHILQASNGLEALKVMDNPDNSVSLILLDLDMPEMNGVEFLRRIRGANNPVPVMVLTGRSTHESARACADLNIQGYVDKIIDVDELIGKIRRVLKIEDYSLLSAIWGEEYETKINSLTPTMKKVIEYVHDNYRKEISREDISARFIITPSHLSRQFHKECGIHLSDYINMLRVSKCKEFLMDLEKDGEEIAKMVGISDANYLYRLFKKYTGLTTKEFRKNHIKR